MSKKSYENLATLPEPVPTVTKKNGNSFPAGRYENKEKSLFYFDLRILLPIEIQLLDTGIENPKLNPPPPPPSAHLSLHCFVPFKNRELLKACAFSSLPILQRKRSGKLVLSCRSGGSAGTSGVKSIRESWRLKKVLLEKKKS
jgi:hypothetical protein